MTDDDATAGPTVDAPAKDAGAAPTKKERKKAQRRAAKAEARERAAEATAGRAFTLDAEQVEAVFVALELGKRDKLLKLVETFHKADLADLIEQVGAEERRRLIDALGADLDGDVLSELDETVRDDVLDSITPAELGEAIKDLESDKVVYLIEDMAEAEQAEVLEQLTAPDRAAVEQSLTYPEDSAGRLMQRDMVWSPDFRTVGDMIDWMRARDDLPDQFYEIVVVDPAMKPVGKVALSRLMGTKRPVTLREIMETDFTVFQADQSQEEVAYAFNQYHLVSAPVTDPDGRLVGVIMIDDAMEAFAEETEQDIRRLGGVADESLGDAVAKIVWRRFPWLAVNLATAVLASMVIGLFDEAINQVVALAILMPIVASMGGNAGTQTLTVAVRAIATKDITQTNAFRIIWREALVGLANGFAFALVVGVVGYVWFDDVTLGVVLAIAMVVNMLVAGLSGILIPLGLDRFGMDPALASGVFVTTVTDVVGFFAFLGVAALILV